MTLCNYCHFDPSLLLLPCEALAGEFCIHDTSLAVVTGNHHYQCFVCTEHGVLGASNHVKIPGCIFSYTHSLCPSKDTTYKRCSDDSVSYLTVKDAKEEEAERTL